MIEKIFVYGTLKGGYGNNHFMGGRQPLGRGYVRGYLFHLGGVPALVLEEKGMNVEGEVYTCTPELIRTLDRLEGYVPGQRENNYGYQRVAIRIPSYGPCWTYTFGHERVNNGEIRDVITNGLWSGLNSPTKKFIAFMNDNPHMERPKLPHAVHDPIAKEWVITQLRPPVIVTGKPVEPSIPEPDVPEEARKACNGIEVAWG